MPTEPSGLFCCFVTFVFPRVDICLIFICLIFMYLLLILLKLMSMPLSRTLHSSFILVLCSLGFLYSCCPTVPSWESLLALSLRFLFLGYSLGLLRYFFQHPPRKRAHSTWGFVTFHFIAPPPLPCSHVCSCVCVRVHVCSYCCLHALISHICCLWNLWKSCAWHCELSLTFRLPSPMSISLYFGSAFWEIISILSANPSFCFNLYFDYFKISRAST